jgi:hypothetical protein
LKTTLPNIPSEELKRIYSPDTHMIMAAGEKSKDLTCWPEPPIATFEAIKKEAREPTYDSIFHGDIWFVGVVLYQDIFGGSYRTTFCLQMRGFYQPVEGGGEGCNHRT